MKLTNLDQQVTTREGKLAVRAIPKTNDNGTPVLDERGNNIIEYQPLTLKLMLSDLLDQSEQGDTGEIKSKITQIQNKLWSEKEPDFTIEQLNLIKERAGKFASIFAYGKIEELIEAK